MPDQTPTAGAIRRAHEWCDLHWPEDENQTPMANVIRHYRATVPAPPKSLADELRAWGKHPAAFAVSTELLALADRVEAVEKELAGTKRDYAECQAELIEADRQRFLGRAEVERLTRDRTVRDSRTVATDPADVTVGEAWRVKARVFGERKEVTGIKIRGNKWRVVDVDVMDAFRLDHEVTLVSRLLPERPARTIEQPEDLNALPSGSSVRRDCRVWSKCWPDGWRGVGYSVEFTPADILTGGPVTVIYTPEEDA